MTRFFAAGLGPGWAPLPPIRRGIALVLGGWIVVVTALAGTDIVAGANTDIPGPAHPGSEAPPGTVATSLAAITQRPLFSISRRPDLPLPMPSAPSPPQLDRQLSLRGVYIDGAQAKAFVVSAEQPEGAWVARGSQIRGWQVAAVSAGQVRFEAGGETFSASLNPEAGHP